MLARILCIFGALSHFGSLMGTLISLLVSGPAVVFAYRVPMTVAGMLRDVTAIVVAYLSFASVRRAVFLLPVHIFLCVLFAGFWIANRSDYPDIPAWSGVALLVFGLIIYVPAYFLLQNRNQTGKDLGA